VTKDIEILQTMKLIEDEYENLKGVLPKNFSIFSKDLLRELLRIFNKEVLQKAEGDLFGKIYEYFLGKFAMTGAQEGEEFFTPMSLAQTIVNVIEPDHGIVFDRAKENDKKKSDKVLMLDARKIYRKVTSKVNDFSPEQLQNLICIVNLYRGNTKKFEQTVKSYLQISTNLAKETADATNELQKKLQKTFKTVGDFANKYAKENKDSKAFMEALNIVEMASVYEQQNKLIAEVKKVKADIDVLENIAHLCKALRKPQDKLIKQLLDAISTATKEFQLNKNKDWKELEIKEKLDQLKAFQQQLSGNPNEEEPGLLHETEYFYKQAHWLTTRFPNGTYTDVEGLCKVVKQKEIEAKDWSLSPGRYVGVDTATDDDFDYEERLNEIHIELEGLNEEAMALANTISENFKELAI
jgi:type I restriction enzyme M protein